MIFFVTFCNSFTGKNIIKYLIVNGHNEIKVVAHPNFPKNFNVDKIIQL